VIGLPSPGVQGPKRPGEAKGGGPKRPGEPAKDTVVPVELPPTMVLTVPPKEGYLTLFTTAQAKVSLRSIPGGNALPEREAPENGVLIYEKLPPGRYRMEITREAHEPLTATISIQRGRPTAVSGPLLEKDGAIILSVGGQVTRESIEKKEAVVKLNGRAIDPRRLEFKDERIYIRGVPITRRPQEISISNKGYADWSQQRVILRGECENLIPVTMVREAITLTLKSLPNAEVYIDGAMKGMIKADRTLSIQGLDPGEYELWVRLDGYDRHTRRLKLALDNRNPVEDVTLEPLADQTEFRASFDPSISQWWPARRQGLQLEPGNPRGLYVREGAFALANNTSRANRTFNIYDDFTFIFNVRFDNGKGAAWVARAQDERNYYLFELNKQEKALNFYICRDGECEKKRPDPVLANIDEEGAFFRIRLEARGNSFSHIIYTREGEQNLGGVIVDDAFRYGGVGLRAINGSEMFVNEFFVRPRK